MPLDRGVHMSQFCQIQRLIVPCHFCVLQDRKAKQIEQSAASFQSDVAAVKERLAIRDGLKVPQSIQKRGEFASEAWLKAEAEKKYRKSKA